MCRDHRPRRSLLQNWDASPITISLSCPRVLKPGCKSPITTHLRMPNLFLLQVPIAECARSLPLPQARSEEHTSELQSLAYLVCRLLLEKKNKSTTVN